jgi:ATP-binding cassette, subfamily C, bacterial PrsD
MATPSWWCLTKPNSNLDVEGDEALTRAILGVRARNGIVVVVTHRLSAISGLDLILAMTQGRQIEFGPKEETPPKVLKRSVPMPLRVAYGTESATA